MTHELVNVHKGSIEYAENEGQGSVFTVTLPLDSSVYESKDFLISTVLMEETDHTDEGIPCRFVKEEQMATPLNKKKILIIEDDTDIREFLKKEIAVYFEVVAEANTKFEEKGLDVRIDHRSYVRQGLDLIPTVHEGSSGCSFSRRSDRKSTRLNSSHLA